MHGVVARDLDSEDFRGLLMFKPPGDLEQQSGPIFFSSGVFHVLMTVVFGFHRFHKVLIIPTCDSASMWPAKKPVQIIIYIMSQRIFF